MLFTNSVCDAIGNYKVRNNLTPAQLTAEEVDAGRHKAKAILFRLGAEIITARDKHPEFAENAYHAYLVIRSELKELEKAIKHESRERQIDEAFDVLVTVMRFILLEYEKKENIS